MYQGTNPTALQSQKWLMDSMKELLLETEYAHITVRDLCKKADLSRQTFYKFFPDKEAVLRYCLEQTYREHFFKLSVQENVTIEEILGIFFSVLESNRPFIEAVIQNNLTAILTDEIRKCISLFATGFVMPKTDDLTFLYSEAMLSGALTQIIVLWTTENNPLPLDQMNALLMDFFNGKLYTI